MSWSAVPVVESPSTNVAGLWPLGVECSSSCGASRRPHGASIGCACAASPASCACESAGSRPGTATSAAASRLLRGKASEVEVVRKNCLGGMYRLAYRPCCQFMCPVISHELPPVQSGIECTTFDDSCSGKAGDPTRCARTDASRVKKVVGYYMARRCPPVFCHRHFMTLSPVSSLTSASSTADARLELLGAWLQSHAGRYGLDLATLKPASADASFRRYFRLAGSGAELVAGGATVIAVDAPPPEKCREFVQVAGLLADAGVHVPRVLEVDLDAGFMLVTDLGTQSYLSTLKQSSPAEAKTLMRDALDALIRWQLASREDVLPPFDEAFLRREMELMPEWFIGRHLGQEVDENTRGVLDRTFALLVASARAQPQVFMLRDFIDRKSTRLNSSHVEISY